MTKIRLAVAGAGGRGYAYAEAVKNDPDVEIVADAEPNQIARERFVADFGVPAEGVFHTWEEMSEVPKLADAMIIAILDRQHRDATVKFADLKYDILLEKPIAPIEAECDDIEAAVQANGVRLTVCHVLHYTPYTVALKELIAAGEIGDIVNIVNIEHLEPIGHTHFAHSFVRGNWRNEALSSSILLQKSCHDIDWLIDVVEKPVERVSSFGSLTHFNAANKPEGAADRCLQCPLQKTCTYSAPRYYLRGIDNPGSAEEYCARVVAGEVTEESILNALETGPYGRCVYASDNDVVDHQTVQMEFAGGVLASFTLTAFSQGANRKTRIFGTKGQVTGDGQFLEVFDFFSEKTRTIDTFAAGHDAATGHGGGDEGLMNSFVKVLRKDKEAVVRSGLSDALVSHRVVFAAERARKAGVIERLTVNA